MYDSSITSKIPGLIYGMVMIFIFDCVILQTSHTFQTLNSISSGNSKHEKKLVNLTANTNQSG